MQGGLRQTGWTPFALAGSRNQSQDTKLCAISYSVRRKCLLFQHDLVSPSPFGSIECHEKEVQVDTESIHNGHLTSVFGTNNFSCVGFTRLIAGSSRKSTMEVCEHTARKNASKSSYQKIK